MKGAGPDVFGRCHEFGLTISRFSWHRLTLRPDGYRLLRATSGRDALDLAASFEGPIDLLLTDAKMPGMGGIELVRELRSRRPDLPVIVMSGYTQELVDFDARGKDILALQKPFSPADLRARIREGLAQHRQM